MKLSFPTEKALEDYVASKIEDTGVCPISGNEVDFFSRQERLGVYGITDILKVNWHLKTLQVTVLELKNEPLKERDLSQLCRYMACLERLLVKYSREFTLFSWELFGELAGPLDKSSDIVFMLSRLENVAIYDVGVSADDGFTSCFVSDGWHMADENIKDTKPLVRRIYREVFDDS